MIPLYAANSFGSGNGPEREDVLMVWRMTKAIFSLSSFSGMASLSSSSTSLMKSSDGTGTAEVGVIVGRFGFSGSLIFEWPGRIQHWPFLRHFGYLVQPFSNHGQ